MWLLLLQEESEFWVPADAAKLGVQFMASKFPSASPRVILDFLRNMNKIWLRRERRKVKRVKEVLGHQIDDLKRQIQAMKYALSFPPLSFLFIDDDTGLTINI